MNRLHCSLLAISVAVGLSAGACGVRADSPARPQGAQQLDDDHGRHIHMDRALDHLHDARHELESAEDISRNHRDDLIAHVETAMKEIELGLKEHRDDAGLPGDSRRILDDERYPHLRRALDDLRDARSELDAADRVFGGHRTEAMEQTEKAIAILADILHDDRDRPHERDHERP